MCVCGNQLAPFLVLTFLRPYIFYSLLSCENISAFFSASIQASQIKVYFCLPHCLVSCFVVMYFRAGRSNPIVLLHYGSTVILTGYTIALCYRSGLLKKVLRKSLYQKMENVVEKVKSKTEPMGSPSCLSMLRNHLLKTYSYTLSGMVAVSAGVVAFMCYPRVPLVIPLGTALISGLVVGAIPSQVVYPSVRRVMFSLCWLAGGYTLGPLCWIAQDSIATYILVTSCTLAGITVPLYVTRGIVSYLLSSQLLSIALSTYFVTCSTSTATLFGVLKTHPGVEQVLHSDIQGMLFMQLISNLTVLSVHTIPNIRRFVNSERPLKEHADPLCEAQMLCAGWLYLGYRLVRGAFHRVLRFFSGKESEGSLSPFSADSKSINIVSSISSGLIIGVLYIQLISRLQKGDIEGSLQSMRRYFRRIAPRMVSSRY